MYYKYQLYISKKLIILLKIIFLIIIIKYNNIEVFKLLLIYERFKIKRIKIKNLSIIIKLNLLFIISSIIINNIERNIIIF